MRSEAAALENFNIAYGASFFRAFAGKYFRIGHLGDINHGTLIGALGITEMALGMVGVPHRKGGVLAAMDFIVSEKSGRKVKFAAITILGEAALGRLARSANSWSGGCPATSPRGHDLADTRRGAGWPWFAKERIGVGLNSCARSLTIHCRRARRPLFGDTFGFSSQGHIPESGLVGWGGGIRTATFPISPRPLGQPLRDEGMIILRSGRAGMSNNIIPKGLAFVCHWSGSASLPGLRRSRGPAPPA